MFKYRKFSSKRGFLFGRKFQKALNWRIKVMCANTKVGYETIVGLVLQYHQCQNKDCPSNAWIAGSTAVYDELGVFCSELCLKEFAGKQAFPST